MGDTATRRPASERARDATDDRQLAGPVFVVSTSDVSFVQGSTEAHYVARLFATSVETHVFAPLSSKLPHAENHSYPFGGFLGVFALNVLFLPYWVWMARRERPRAVYAYGNVLVPPLVVRAVTGATVVHDLQCDPHDQLREFAEEDDASLLFSPVLWGVKLAHRLVLPRSDAVVTLSDHLAEKIRHNYGVAPQDVHVVPLGADTRTFAPDVASSLPPTDRLRVAYLGAIEHYRGLDAVVEGLATLDDDRRERVRFDVFGAGDEAFVADLRQTAEAAGVRLVYHGHLDHDEVPAALAGCDLAVSPLPPLDSYLVSCPAKVFEYLAAGLPILATDIPPHERHLTDGEDALLFDPGDADSLAAAVSRLLDDPDERSRMAANARQTALANDWTDRFRRISEVVAGAQATRAGGDGP